MSGQLKLLHMSSVIHYPGEELELFEEAKKLESVYERNAPALYQGKGS